MKPLHAVLFSLAMLFATACSKEEITTGIEDPIESEATLYFPPLDDDQWANIDLDSLGWDSQGFEDLGMWLEEKNTRAFIILKDGQIAYESYWGTSLQGDQAFDENTNWYWASAGKSLMSSLTGKAQELSLLNIEDPTSLYLGNGWTSMPVEQENEILIRHQLCMTTGLDYTVPDVDCTSSDCLMYNADPGTQWYYHNAPYSLLAPVIESAANTSLNNFVDEHILQPIGMEGLWLPNGDGRLFFSTAKSAARFGLLALNEFDWDGKAILTDKEYVQRMTNSSQDLNPSYGYLWWLNGKSSIVVPGLANSFNLPLSESAPDDLVAAMGKNGQFIEYVPSKNIVVVRFGDAPDASPAAISFHDEMWSLLSPLIN